MWCSTRSARSRNWQEGFEPCLLAPKNGRAELLKGWLRGDGGLEVSSRNRVKLLGTSASETLARQMFLLAMRCGLRPSFKVRAGRVFGVYFAAEDAIALGWLRHVRRFRSSRRIINGHILACVREIARRPYGGSVFDLDVDGDNLIAAPFALVHNCDPPSPRGAKAPHVRSVPTQLR
jgi:hypothetical protein